MKILYDHQVFNWQVYGGISRYFFELIRKFRQNGFLNVELSLLYTNNHYIKDNNLGVYNTFLPRFNFRGKSRIMSILNKTESKKALLRREFDIFHPTYYQPYFLKYLRQTPFVLTIHDMIHEIFPQYFSIRERQISNHKRLLAQKATRIIAVSENTKKDIMKFYGINEDKIVVTYLANSLSRHGGRVPTVNFNLPERYLLFVGERHEYKNFRFFVKSVASLMAEDNALGIICTGGRPFSVQEKSLFDQLKIENRIFRMAVTDEEMVWLYKNALAFVFPSLYEGFGIPVLEAFVCGCPVVLSKSSSLPEVGREAAIYFDPTCSDSIQTAVKKVICDENKRQDLKNRGLKQAESFSWDKTAAETEAVYRSII